MHNFYILSSIKNFQNISKILPLYHPNKFGQIYFIQSLNSIKKDLPNFKSEVLFLGDVIREPVFNDPYLLGNFSLIFIPFSIYEKEKDVLLGLNDEIKNNIHVYLEWRYTCYLKNTLDLLRTGNFGHCGINRLHIWMNKSYCSSVVSEPNIYRLIDIANSISISKARSFLVMKSKIEKNFLQIHCLHEDHSTSLISNFVSDSQYSNYFSLTIVGSDGAIYADDHQNIHLVSTNYGSNFEVQSPFNEYDLLDVFNDLSLFPNNTGSRIIPLINLPNLEKSFLAKELTLSPINVY